jgi:PKD repeat protein
MLKATRNIFLTALTSLIYFNSYACIADFDFTEFSPLNVQFHNQSDSHNSSVAHYYWDFGDGNTSFDIEPIYVYSEPGIYKVSLTIITIDLCINTFVKDIYIGVPANSPYCFIELNFSTYNATAPNYNNGAAQVYGFSDVPCCYYAYWSNGMEGEVIGGLSPGTYCVTITNGETCFGSSCVTIGYNNNCHASFIVDSTSFAHMIGTYRFINNSNGEEDFYLWDFGDGQTSELYNPIHVYSEPGIYEVCLTIKTHYNCETTYCKTVYVNSVIPVTATIEGRVRAGDSDIPDGVAVLYKHSNNTFQAIDYSYINQGQYIFPDLPKDNHYLIHTIPRFNIDETYFPKYIASYNSNHSLWQYANLIYLNCDTVLNTQLYSYNEIYYNDGSISGNVSYSDTISYEENIFHRNWYESEETESSKASNMVILLKSSNKEIMDFSVSKTTGEYVFSNLEYGGYYISVEKPGLLSDEVFVVISENSHEQSNIDFTISGYTATNNTLLTHKTTIEIYPNPVTDYLYILNGSNADIYSISDVQGKLIAKGNITSDNYKLELGEITPGMYIITITTQTYIVTQKFTKQ